MKKHIMRAAVLALAGFMAAGAAAQTNVWQLTGINNWYGSTDNWSLAHFPLAGEDVVIINANTGVVLTNSAPAAGWFNSLIISNTATLIFTNWTTALSATDVNIQKSAIVTCAGPFSNAPAMSNRVYLVCSNLTVETGGQINVDYRGYTGYAGPGAAPTNNIKWGGSYGGMQGDPDGTNYPYGSSNAPMDPGSGGGGATRAGGGLVCIVASNLLTINGTISANGIAGAYEGGWVGAGSGGGVYLRCKTLAGTGGVVRASGGVGEVPHNYCAGGGGGRIAVIYDPASQAAAPLPMLTFQALGGAGPGAARGDLGTLFFTDNQLLISPVVHSGQWLVPGVTNWSLDSLTLTNAWIRLSGFALTVTNNVLITGSDPACYGLQLIDGSVAGGGDLTLLSAGLTLFNSGALTTSLDVAGNLVLTNVGTAGGALSIYAGMTNAAGPDYGARVQVNGTLYVSTNSTIYPYSHGTNGGSVLFSVKDFTVAGGGLVNATAKGYAGNAGPGAPPDEDLGW